jgi:hypothetical protein
MLCTLATLWTLETKIMGVLKMVRFLSFYALAINPTEKEWEKFM